MVGRIGLLSRVDELLQRPAPQQATVLFLTGAGGIGKTRFLRDALERAGKDSALISARQVIDLYHIRNHTTDGLIESICAVLPSEAFAAYEKERVTLERMRLAGDPSKLGEQHKIVFDSFAADLRRLAANKPVVIALDTAEKLLYATSHPAQGIGDAAESWQWLGKVLPTLQNVVLLVAGRPGSEKLQTYMTHEDIAFIVEDIPPFSLEESLAYFETVLKMDLAGGAGQAIGRLTAFDEEMRRTAAICAGGLPITLALLLDFLSVASASEIPEDIKLSPAEAAKRMEVDSDGVQRRLHEAFIRRLLSAHRIGDTILALGRLPKGADAELLAKVMGVEIDEANNRLASVRNLSIVKIRPSDHRYFLHDLLYEILREYVFGGPEDTGAGIVSEQILEYYDELLRRVQQKITDWFQPVFVTGNPSSELLELAAFIVDRQAILSEILYYRLRQDTVSGFKRYYRYMREAILSGQVLLDLLLQIELLSFWLEKEVDSMEDEVDGVPRDVVEGILEIRPVTRAWAEGSYQLAIQRVDDIQRERPELFQQSRGTRSIFDGWKAFSLIMLGGAENWATARALLDKGITILSLAIIENLSEIRLWRAKAVLAFCYRVRGYLSRVQGNNRDAVTDYRDAVRLWRDTNFLIELARTLNDLGFAHSELGENALARALVEEALEILENLGQYTLAGLSVNTLAMIDIKQESSAGARANAAKAYTIFRSLQYQRGVGLALIARSEATRRYSATATLTLPERAELLMEARKYAREAVSIFDGIHAEENRLVEALIEVGCACRDWVRLQREHPSLADNLDALKKESQSALERAADEAGAAIPYRHLDALVNLAWLGFYTGDARLLESATQRAQDATPKDYYIDPSKGVPSVDRATAQLLIWPQVGKLFTVHGFHELIQFMKTVETTPERETYLRNAIRLLALGLEHSILYSENYQGLNQAKQQTLSSLKQLKLKDLRIVTDSLKEFEAEYHLKGANNDRISVMRNFLESHTLL